MENDPDVVPRSSVLKTMRHEETKALLNSILEWLGSGSNDDDDWDGYTDFADVCLEMLATSEAAPSPIIQTGGRQHVAIRHVRAMISAMKIRDQAGALENGQAAIDAM